MEHPSIHARQLDPEGVAINFAIGFASIGVILYTVAAVYAIYWAVVEKALPPRPEDPYRLPRCYTYHLIRYPLAFIWPGFLWPAWLVFVNLRRKCVEWRVRRLFPDENNNGHRLEPV